MIKAFNGLNYATYEEWRSLGKQVLKGEKSYMVDENSFEPLFSEKQLKSSEGRMPSVFDRPGFGDVSDPGDYDLNDSYPFGPDDDIPF